MKTNNKILSISIITFLLGVIIGYIVSSNLHDKSSLTDRPTKQAYYSNLEKVIQYEKELIDNWPKELDFKYTSSIDSIKNLTALQEKALNTDIQNEKLFWKTKNAELQKVMIQIQLGHYSIENYQHIQKQNP